MAVCTNGDRHPLRPFILKFKRRYRAVVHTGAAGRTQLGIGHGPQQGLGFQYFQDFGLSLAQTARQFLRSSATLRGVGRYWDLELMADDPDHLDGLLTADAARKNAQQDLRWFRRRVATELWSAADAVGTSLGFLLALGSVATVREILGMGTKQAGYGFLVGDQLAYGFAVLGDNDLVPLQSELEFSSN